jgi:PIN domain nuclease of toxin-antitoxin system
MTDRHAARRRSGTPPPAPPRRRADLSTRLTAQGLIVLSITAEHAEAIRDFPELVRHDPFDRLLVARASRAGRQLLTADQVLLQLGRDFILDAAR